MQISIEQAIEIFAKSLRRSHGRQAQNYARERAASCQRQEDYEGSDVWSQVAETVVKLEQHQTVQ
jgi:hypothetical protein